MMLREPEPLLVVLSQSGWIVQCSGSVISLINDQAQWSRITLSGVQGTVEWIRLSVACTLNPELCVSTLSLVYGSFISEQNHPSFFLFDYCGMALCRAVVIQPSSISQSLVDGLISLSHSDARGASQFTSVFTHSLMGWCCYSSGLDRLVIYNCGVLFVFT